MRVTLLHNPGSGDEDVRGRDLVAVLSDAGHEVTYRSLRDEGWANVLDESRDLIVIAGGDGSVRKVFTALGGSPTLTTLVPTGSANNIARTLGIETDDPVQLVAGWERGKRHAFDVWDVASASHRDRFVESFGGGILGDVLDRADDEPDQPSGDDKLERGLCLLREALVAAPVEAWNLELDGDRVSEELLGFAAMNVRELGPNIPLAADADPRDGLFDVVLLHRSDRAGLIDHVEARLRGDGAAPPELATRRASRLVVEQSSGSPLHVDDELPLEFEESEIRSVTVTRAELQIEVLIPSVP